MTATLTERYVHDTIRRLPPDARDDVRRELEASIADAVEARGNEGVSLAEAERLALEDLGDPAVLASGFADRPLALIGPRFFLLWWRILKVLLWSVPPVAGAGVAIGHAIAEEPVGTIIAESIVVMISAIMHVFFWTTIVFAVLDRSGARIAARWTVDRLPEAPERQGGVADAIASGVVLMLVVTAVLWDYARGFAFLNGSWTSVLSAELWPWWIAGLFSVVLAEAVFVVVRARRGVWTVGLAVIRTAIAIVFVSWAASVIGRGLLLATEIVAAFQAVGVGADVMRILAILLIVGIAVTAVAAVVQAWRGVRRAG
ncbi:MAG: permease prefix domain 1-containing protein [Microbacterium gubbeenense]|uniref:permease prefix domain 1-containing protein n=1 Tax=Microbacterium gubbeenense TaxID=159896 RepID=UPI0003FBF4D7|nr:permease prefix domain 1-containing protein [Microbacterium gubbeenense]